MRSGYDLRSKGAPKTPQLVAVKGSRNSEDVSDLDITISDAQNPATQVPPFTGQHTPQDFTEAQRQGGDEDPHSASGSTEKAPESLKTFNCAPPQTIRVARFAKDEMDPIIVVRQTVDVTPDKHRGDDRLKNIPDFHEDWGDNENWKIERKADRFFVAPDDIPGYPQLHGWYVVFSLHEPRYDSNTHSIFGGFGRHIHEDIFIAKLGAEIVHNGWACYVDMPEEFLSATSKENRKLFYIPLIEHGRSMLASLIA